MLARLLHFILTTLFALYIACRRLIHAVTYRVSALLSYHHRSPDRYIARPIVQRTTSDTLAVSITTLPAKVRWCSHITVIKRDVKSLKLPTHLSAILTLPSETRDVTLLLNRLDTTVYDACELIAWCAAAGIPVLSIYERSGLLKSSLTHLHTRIEQTLDAYYRTDPAARPTFSLRAPGLPAYEPSRSSHPTNGVALASKSHLDILLLDASDGRQTLVELTKTLAQMLRSGKLETSQDISPELIDAELTESVMGEPDLLILFGDKASLDGYPPWQVRLTEIFALQDNRGARVGYNCFLRGLYKYAKAEMRLGR